MARRSNLDRPQVSLSSTLIALGLLSILACNSSDEYWPIAPKPGPPPITIVSVDPAVGYAGTLIKVTLHKLTDSIYVDSECRLNGDPFYLSREDHDSLWLRFPRVLSFTGLYISAYDYRTDSVYKLKVDFMPYPEICSQPICIKWYDDDTVTQAISREYNYGQPWSYNISGDTVRLQTYDNMPNSELRKYLTFVSNGSGNLPTFLHYSLRGVLIRDTLRIGLVKIDQWNTHGIISGGVFWSNEGNTPLKYHQNYFFVTLP